METEVNTLRTVRADFTLKDVIEMFINTGAIPTWVHPSTVTVKFDGTGKVVSHDRIFNLTVIDSRDPGDES